MNTTAMFVEILIIGLQSIIWFGLLIITLFGENWLILLRDFSEGYESIIVILIIGFCYTMGIIIDRIADFIFELYKPQTLLIKFKIINKWIDKAHSKKRIIKSLKDIGSYYVMYIRSRIRILRSTIINLTLIIFISIVYFIQNEFIFNIRISLKYLIRFNALLLIIILILIFVLGLLQLTEEKRLDQVYKN
ncbi:MAG: hypothetical protein JXB49_21095 [Bacteroidales bacterium]|nr:hypothetical protein [Bacteroidales bacterium]